jgi:hypothetical protein
VFVSTWVSHGLHSGVRGALVAFLAWAIVRELAPKRALASLLAPFAAVAFAIPADSDVLACVGVLMAARTAARTVGDPPTLLDCAALVALAGWLATRPDALPVALVLAAVVFADGPPLRLRLAGLAALATALVVGSVEGTLTLRPGWPELALQAQVLVAVAAAATVWLLVAHVPTRLRARDDRHGGQLRGARIRSARIVTVAAVVATVAWIGSDAVFSLSAACAALLAAGLGGARLPAPRSSVSRTWA